MSLSNILAASGLARLAFTLPVLASLFLSGCATVPPEVPPAEHLKTDGFVVVRVFVNAPMIGLMAPSFYAIGLKNTDNKKSDAVLMPLDYASFGGWVPAGSYKIGNELALSPIGNVVVSAGESLTGTVEVKPGHVNDLQTLIYQPIGAQSDIFIPVKAGMDVPATLKRDEPTVADQLLASGISTADLQTAIPLKAGTEGRGASGQGPIGDLLMHWSDAASATEKQLRWADAKNGDDLISLAKQSTTRLDGGYFMPDGSIVFGSSLGQILLRTPDASWRFIDTGRLDDVSYVVGEGPNLLASLADGSVIFSSDAGVHWNTVRVSQPIPAALRIYPMGADGYLLICQTGTPGHYGMDVYKFAGPVAGNLTLVKHLDLGITFAMFLPSDIAMVKGRLFIAQDDNHINIFDTKTGVWSLQQTQSDFSRIKVSNDGEIVDLMGANGVFGTDYMSVDGGEHWEKTKIPFSAIDAHFITHDIGIGLDNDMGAFSSTTQPMSTSDGGRTWVRGPAMQERCVDFLAIDKTREYLCSTMSGKIMSSTDGKHWTIERAVR